MIDFSTLKGLTIPEGVVTQITDAAGNVLWSAMENVTITITGSITYGFISIDGTTYKSAATVEVPVGTVIRCFAYGYSCDCGEVYSYGSGTYLNGKSVSTGVQSGTSYYDYTVVGNATIRLEEIEGDYCWDCEVYSSDSYIYITESYAVTVDAVENGTLTANAESVAVGSTVTLTATPDDGYTYGGATVTYADGTAYATLDSETLTFTMPAADVVVTPVWSEVKPTVEIKIRGHYAFTYAFVEIDGTRFEPTNDYTGATATLSIPIGTVISCTVVAEYGANEYSYIRLNGSLVAQPAAYGTVCYDYIVTTNATINMTSYGDDGDYYGQIEITEE